MADIADVLKQAEDVDNRRTAKVRVLLRQDLARQHADLDAELQVAITDDARYNRTPQAPALSERIVELEAEMEDAKVEFVFRALPRREWANLITKHPPTKAQIKALADLSPDPLRRTALDFNPDTFPIAAIAATCIDPVMSVDDVAKLENAVSDEQWSRLWSAVVDVNVGSSDPKASRAAGLILRLNARSESTAAPEESADPSS